MLIKIVRLNNFLLSFSAISLFIYEKFAKRENFL